MAVVNDDREVFAGEEEGDNDVGADVAQSAGDEDFLRGVSGRRGDWTAPEQGRGNDAVRQRAQIKSVR